jgi:hypothetical protein
MFAKIQASSELSSSKQLSAQSPSKELTECDVHGLKPCFKIYLDKSAQNLFQ